MGLREASIVHEISMTMGSGRGGGGITPIRAWLGRTFDCRFSRRRFPLTSTPQRSARNRFARLIRPLHGRQLLRHKHLDSQPEVSA